MLTGIKCEGWNGGADGIRTHDLLDAIEARSQLRHGPTEALSPLYHPQRAASKPGPSGAGIAFACRSLTPLSKVAQAPRPPSPSRARLDTIKRMMRQDE